MSGGADALRYNLCLDAACAEVWGDGTAGTGRYVRSFPPDATVVQVTVYGQIPAGQDVAAGSYTDSVIATINF